MTIEIVVSILGICTLIGLCIVLILMKKDLCSKIENKTIQLQEENEKLKTEIFKLIKDRKALNEKFNHPVFEGNTTPVFEKGDGVQISEEPEKKEEEELDDDEIEDIIKDCSSPDAG